MAHARLRAPGGAGVAAVQAKADDHAPDPTVPAKGAGGDDFRAVADFARRYMTHYNGGTLVRAAEAYCQRIQAGDAMMVTLAGAFSTGEGGKWLAEMIRRDLVHAISCTGANLEEDVFNLVAHDEYVALPRYRNLTPKDEEKLRKANVNRVTDAAIPDKAMEPVIHALQDLWEEADRDGQRYFPHEYFYRVLREGTLEEHYQIDPADSWMLAAAEKDLPIVVPGYEDSSSGNAFIAAVMQGEIADVGVMKSGMEAMAYLADWYRETAKDRKIGFWQLGGGIAGDFPICVVPMLHLELKEKKLPLWSYFCQIGDSHESYGGYSGASPSEKQTWLKLEEHTPAFEIHSDYTAIAPLMAAIIMGEEY